MKERTRSLRLEGLEDRTLLAGNVAVDLLPDGTLQIVGDHSDNGIAD